MNAATINLIVQLVLALVTTALPNIIQVVTNWKGDTNNVTEADIAELLDALKQPADYFKTD